MQTNASTADKSGKVLNKWFNEIVKLYKPTRKQDLNIVKGNFNAKVGAGKVTDLVGKYRVGKRNEQSNN